jgi:hypothetical protein
MQSMTNEVYRDVARVSKTVAPEVGMGATELMASDRHAYTIFNVISPREFQAREDKAIRTDNNGMSDAQSYRYEADPNGKVRTVTLRRNGQWVTRGEGMRNGTSWLIGVRQAYYDYSF